MGPHQYQAVRQVSNDWPEAVLWPMGFLLDRLRRRLAETHGAVAAAPGRASQWSLTSDFAAERVGFEPTVSRNPQRLSRPSA